MKRTKLHTLLIAATLVLVMINLYGTFTLYSSFDAITARADVKEPSRAAIPDGQARIDVSLDDDPAKGDLNAPVTIVEFSDFQCPFCARFFTQTLPQIEAQYIKTGKARLVYRDFPLGFHANAHKAAEAAACAGDQGRFWEYHDLLFKNQQSLGSPLFKQIAIDLGLDTARFSTCLDTGEKAAEVDNDVAQGASYGVSGTPAFFINGRLVSGAQPYAVFQQMIEEELAR